MGKVISTPGIGKPVPANCGTQSIEYCPTDTTPITLQNIVDAIIARGGTFGDGTAIPGNVVGTDLNVDSINIVANSAGVRSWDQLTGALVFPDECGLLVTNNGGQIFAEANETKTVDVIYDDFALAAAAGTTCFQVDVTFSPVAA